MLKVGLRQLPLVLMLRRMVHMDLIKLGSMFWRVSREGAGASLMSSWMNSVVVLSFHTAVMVSLTVLFSRVAKPLMAKRKSGQAGSRGAM